MTFFCPVCGYPGLDEPPYMDYEVGSNDICPCCGVEFGLADGGRLGEALQAKIIEIRNTWVERGMCWRSRSEKPPEQWDPARQLENLRQDKGPSAGAGRYEYYPREFNGHGQ